MGPLATSALPVIRNLRFETNASVPRHWLGGRRSVTSFFDNLSVFFPLGERFFVTSVRAHERFVKAPELLAALRSFCGQEGIHGREHDRYNRMLAARGYPVAAMEERVERLLRFVSRVLPIRSQLAATCALEHFTALMGQMLLADPTILEDAEPTMAALWRWHAAEENEHKSVAYDVFRAAGGTYAERVTIMALASVVFWTKVLEHQARMMKIDGTLSSAHEWAALVEFLFVKPGGMARVVRRYFDYYRPDFHPRDIDSDDLVDAWARGNEPPRATRSSGRVEAIPRRGPRAP
jgi:predicted metal-dependent hydrolase